MFFCQKDPKRLVSAAQNPYLKRTKSVFNLYKNQIYNMGFEEPSSSSKFRFFSQGLLF